MSFLRKIFNFFGCAKALDTVVGWKLNFPQKNPTTSTNLVLNRPIQYVINDPTTPQLIKQMTPPTYTGRPTIAVRGYQGGGFSRSSVQGQAANCYVTVTDTIKLINSKSERALPNWPGTSTLQVIPRAGVDLNAYYDRRSLQFFYATDPRIGGSIFTCDSADVVAHELGHAILDTFRPQTWSVAYLEVASFHEAFADLIAIMHGLYYDEIINYVITETNGNLRNNNVVSRLAEQFGVAIYRLSGPSSGRNPDCLRSAINNFKYVNPGTLPADAPENQLAAECHSFGRIFLGAFYDILVMMYEDIRSTGKAPNVALKEARDLLLRYTLKSIQNAPINAKFYNSMAKTLLWSDVVLSNRKYHDRMQGILSNRNLLTTPLMMLSAPKCENDDLNIKIQGCMNIKLEDFVIKAQNDDNPLYGVEIELPIERIYLYDNNRNLYDSVSVNEEEAISAGIDMIKYLHTTNSVSNDTRTPFEIIDGKLVRTHIS